MSGKRLKIPIQAAEAVEERARFLIRPEELKRRLDAGEKLVLIDVRSELEHRALRLEGARLATRPLVEEIFTTWDKGTPLVVFDHFGKDALTAARALSSRGFTDAKALAGGLDAWSQTIDPLLPRY